MSDTRNTMNQANDPTPSGETDWGRKLREFMQRQAQASSQTAASPSAGTRGNDAGQDKLDELLKAQLKQSAPAAAPAPEPAPAAETPEQDEVPADEVTDESVDKSADESADEPANEPADESSDEPAAVPVPEPGEEAGTEPEPEDEPASESGIESEPEDEPEPEPEDESEIESESEDEPKDEPEPIPAPVPAPAPVSRPAPVVNDEALNGTSVADMMDSGVFMENLDADLREAVREVWARRAEPAEEEVTSALVPDLPAEESDDESAAEAADTPVYMEEPEDALAENEPDTDTDAAPVAVGTVSDDIVRDDTVPDNDSVPEAGEADALDAIPLLPGRRAHGASKAKPAADPMQISLSPTFRLMDEGLFPEEPPARPAPEPAAPPPAEAAEAPDAGEQPVDEDAAEVQDTALYMSLGYENELRRTPEGADRADRVHSRLDASQPVGTRNTIPFAFSGKEYNGKAMTASVESAYRGARVRSLLRLILSAVGAAALLVFDGLSLFASGDPGLTELVASPLYPAVEICLLIAFCLPCARRLWLGLRSVMDFEPVRFCVPAVSAVFVLLYEIVAAVTVGAAAVPTCMPLFGGVVLLLLTVACVCDDFALRAERRSFRVVSSGRASYIMTTVNHADRGSEGQSDSRYAVTLRVCRTDRLSDFFVRANKPNARLSALTTLIPAALLFAILAGGVGMLLGGSEDGEAVNLLLQDGLPVFMAAFLACMPGAYLISLSLPLYLTDRTLGEHGCTVVGEAAPEQYAPAKRVKRGVSRVVIPDGYALSAVSVKEYTDPKDPDAARWRTLAHKVFSLTECSLRTVGEPVSRRELSCLRAELTRVADGLLHLHISDTRTGSVVEVMAGTYEALAAVGVALPADGKPDRFRAAEGDDVLYLAFDRRLRMVCSVCVKPDALFLQAVDTLERQGCRTAITTYDPFVTRQRMAADGLSHVDLIRPRRMSKLFAPRSSGLVASRRAVDLFRALLGCRRMQDAYSRGLGLAWIFLLAAGILTSVLRLFAADLSVLPLLVCLWQLLAAGVSVWSAVRLINRRTLAIEENGEEQL